MTTIITKDQVGLGNVANYKPANFEDALNPNITNEYITPQTLQYALDKAIEPAGLEDPGMVLVNNAVFLDDDKDQIKSLTAKGLTNLLNNTGSVFNEIQSAVLNLNKRVIYTGELVMGDCNNITMTLTPHCPTDKINGLVRFIAVFNNTGPVTLNTGNMPLPITLWNGSQLIENSIIKGDQYALLPMGNTLVLLNPNSDIDLFNVNRLLEKYTDIISSDDPFPIYAKGDGVDKKISDNSFKGSYVGLATLNNGTYNVTLPYSSIELGVFAIKFNNVNPFDCSLSLNGATKQLQYINGDKIEAGELFEEDIRIIINTPAAYLVLKVNDATIDSIKEILTSHLSSSDPHSSYWNNERGLEKVNEAITNAIDSKVINNNTIINVTTFPPDVIIKNATYYVGEIGGEKEVYTTDSSGNISFQLGGKKYRFFNSNGEQIG